MKDPAIKVSDLRAPWKGWALWIKASLLPTTTTYVMGAHLGVLIHLKEERRFPAAALAFRHLIENVNGKEGLPIFPHTIYELCASLKMPIRTVFPQDAGPVCPIFELSKVEGHSTSRPTWKICLTPDINNDLVGTDARGRKEPLMTRGTMQLAPQPISSYCPGGSQQVVVRDEETLQELRVIKTQLHTNAKKWELQGQINAQQDKRYDALETKLEKHEHVFERILDRLDRQEEERKKEEEEKKKEKKEEKKERKKEKEQSDKVMTMLLEQLRSINQRDAEREEKKRMKDLGREAAAVRFEEDVALRERASRPTGGGVGASSRPTTVDVEDDEEGEKAEVEEARKEKSAEEDGAETQEVAEEGEAAQPDENISVEDQHELKEKEPSEEERKEENEKQSTAGEWSTEDYLLDEPIQPSEDVISTEKAPEEAKAASKSTEQQD